MVSGKKSLNSENVCTCCCACWTRPNDVAVAVTTLHRRRAAAYVRVPSRTAIRRIFRIGGWRNPCGSTA